MPCSHRCFNACLTCLKSSPEPIQRRLSHYVKRSRFWLSCLVSGVFFLLSVTPVDVAHGMATSPSFAHILEPEIETLGHINSITEDRHGFIWIAGQNGLARYDGYRVQIYQRERGVDGGLPHSTVNDLYKDQSGQLWFATRSGLGRFNEQAESIDVFRPKAKNWNAQANTLQSIEENPGHGLWVGTRNGLFQFNPRSGEFAEVGLDQGEQAVNPGVIWDLARDSNGGLWVATQKHGLMYRDAQANQFRSWQLDGSLGKSDMDIRAVFCDAQGNVWAGSYSGNVYLLTVGANQFVPLEHNSQYRKDAIWKITQDAAGRIWVGGGAGLLFVDRINKSMHLFKHDPTNPRSIGNYAVKTVFSDSQGELWLGFFPAGVDRVDWSASIFSNHINNPLGANSVAPGGVLSVVEDSNQNLWIGAGLGLSFYNRSSGRFTQWKSIEDGGTVLGDTTTSLLLDSKGYLWAGSWSKGLNKIELKSGAAEHFREQPDKPNSLWGVEPWDLLEDQKGDIWVATERGLNRYLPEHSGFERYVLSEVMDSPQSDIKARVLYEDRAGAVWVGTNEGLFKRDPISGDFSVYRHDPAQPDSLSDHSIRALFEDQNGNFWVGTQNGGLNKMDRQNGTFSSVGTGQGFATSSVTSIVEDATGVLWFTTLQGLVRFDVKDQQFKVVTKRHGLLDNLFNRKAALMLRSGELFLGSSKGFTVFDPQLLRSNNNPPRIVFTQLKVFNEPVKPGVERSPLGESILNAKKLTLHPNQSVFSVEFSALNFNRAEDNVYQVMLEGFHTEWQPASKKNHVTFTNLDPGEYRLRVRAANSDGVWADTEAQLLVHALPPWWQSIWAYGLYTILALLLFILIGMVQVKRVQLTQEKRLNAKLRKLDKVKDVFLASTSHELRTPLNGMIGLADHLIEDAEKSFPSSMLNKLEMIRSSGKRLACLVNDILDYSKLAEHSLELRIRPVDLNAAFCEVMHLMLPLANAKKLKVVVKNTGSLPWVMADENRLQQILINLVGNAIKFTDQGEVSIDVSNQENLVRICISDTGVGIAKDSVQSVFVAFNQLDTPAQKSTRGTGLGLAISKRLVEMQGGEIGVESDFGKGSQFWFTLKRAAYSQSARTGVPSRAGQARKTNRVTEELGSQVASEISSDKVKMLPLIEHPEQFTIMIVDDDPVNRMVLRGILEHQKYNVVEMNNGQQALDYLSEGHAIHLILLDIMMPLVDGFKVCADIRTNRSIHALPIFFLTAHKNDEDLQKGFMVGANEFLTKPVSKFELLGLIANHLRVVKINEQLTQPNRAL